MTRDSTTVCWVILTMGDRPVELRDAVASIRSVDATSRVVVVANGGPADAVSGAEVIGLPRNVGVPGGRAHAVRAADADLYVFLDDDARVVDLDPADLVRSFDVEPRLAVVSFRIVDELGESARRHIPRPGRRGTAAGGNVVTFLGGACAVRAAAYHQVGGYWDDLWYGHEELDLAWRLADAAWTVRYAPEHVVFHPRAEISRHAEGWRLTGRNRVMVARRNLPWLLVPVHTTVWLLLGSIRTGSSATRRAYWSGWASGWRCPVDRDPIGWRTVWRLCRLGRPPII